MRKLEDLRTLQDSQRGVSVPLRGLDMRKLCLLTCVEHHLAVSVPLRGLDMRKQWIKQEYCVEMAGFSPLAGIRYAETPPSET